MGGRVVKYKFLELHIFPQKQITESVISGLTTRRRKDTKEITRGENIEKAFLRERFWEREFEQLRGGETTEKIELAKGTSEYTLMQI